MIKICATAIFLFLSFLLNAQNTIKENKTDELLALSEDLENSNLGKADSILEIAFRIAKNNNKKDQLVKILTKRVSYNLNLDRLQLADSLNKRLGLLARNSNEKTLVDYNQAKIFMLQSELSKAIRLFHNVLREYEKNKDSHKVISTSTNLAWCYYLNNQNEIAKTILKNAIKVANETGYNDLGPIYEKLGIQYTNNYATQDSAMYYFELAEKYYHDDLISITYLTNNKAGIYFNNSEYEKAILNYEKALDGFTKANLSHEYYYVYSNLGISYLNCGKIKESEYYLTKAYDLVKLDSIPTDKALLINEDDALYFNLARLYEEKKDFKKAYEFLRIERSIKNAKFDVQYQEEIMALTKSNEMIKKENEINKFKQLQITNKNARYKWLFISIILLFLIGIIAMYFYNKLNSEKKQLLIKSAFEKENIRLKTKEEERKRISRDLHDNIGAYAATIINNAENLSFESKSFEQNPFLTEINANAKNMLESIRETLVILNNKPIDYKTMIDKFKLFSNDILQSYPQITLQIDDCINDNISLEVTDGVNLLHILKEMFNNAIKHSKASLLVLNLTESNNNYTIAFSDNGTGFDTENTMMRNGIENIKYRAEQLNAEIDLHSSPSVGTRWVLKLDPKRR